MGVPGGDTAEHEVAAGDTPERLPRCVHEKERAVHPVAWVQPTDNCRRRLPVLQLLGASGTTVRLPLPRLLLAVHDQAALCGRHILHPTAGPRAPIQQDGRLLLPHGQSLPALRHDRSWRRLEPPNAQLPRGRGGPAERRQEPRLWRVLGGRLLHCVHQVHARPARAVRSQAREDVLRGVLGSGCGRRRRDLHNGPDVLRVGRDVRPLPHDGAERVPDAGHTGFPVGVAHHHKLARRDGRAEALQGRGRSE
mmetsp:Transcript_21469/g.50457  ORF Transcript_21469/g.50457 Transcript_21469/m.50457 type:complete len:251 (+) Transcript_21469:552-1304(+)